MEFIPRFFKSPKESFFLFGPRGTGKSLLVRERFKDALYIDFLKDKTFREFTTHPSRLEEHILGNPDKKVIIIDEVQKVPSVLDEVHLLMEKRRGLQFILTGSSPRKLKRTGVNLLGGRALLKNMHPFLAAELKDKFDLKTALNFGMLPLVWSSQDKRDKLEAYINLYIREEIQQEALVRDIRNFSMFLEAASFSHGSLLNITNISSECGVERKTVEGYLDILESLLLMKRLHVFRKRAKRKIISHPKLYFFDAGVFRTIRPKGPYDKPEEIDGMALEGLIYQQLVAWNETQKEKNELFFWRTRTGAEVDFILYGESGINGVEVKNSDKIRNGDLKSLNLFKNEYPLAKLFFLYRGEEKLKIGDVMCVPCEDFLKRLIPGNPGLYFD